jgi:hypothetical protein
MAFWPFWRFGNGDAGRYRDFSFVAKKKHDSLKKRKKEKRNKKEKKKGKTKKE